eukprot:4489051-Alexandrium_andersonii.AAC.1
MRPSRTRATRVRLGPCVSAVAGSSSSSSSSSSVRVHLGSAREPAAHPAVLPLPTVARSRSAS